MSGSCKLKTHNFLILILNLTNKLTTIYVVVWCLPVSQRYNLKANHNGLNVVPVLSQGVYQ